MYNKFESNCLCFLVVLRKESFHPTSKNTHVITGLSWDVWRCYVRVFLISLEKKSVATPAEPRGENKLFFVQILGGEKLLKFVEKCR